MPRNWVIAPWEADDPEAFDRVWQFDLDNNMISIGWRAAGDVSKMSREGLATAITSAYPGSPPPTRALYGNMLWNFYHEVAPGDSVLARRGQKILEAVGRVTSRAIFSPGSTADPSHPGLLRAEWQNEPRHKIFSSLVFPRFTLKELSDAELRSLLEGPGIAPDAADGEESLDRASFVLEKYLEEFIVSNFDVIFKGKLEIYRDPKDAQVDGRQYATEVGPIDILAVERDSRGFVVIELKKGRPSDQVVGQVLRYMGWVKKNLCRDNQEPKGLIVCHEPDPKLSYALAMTKDIDLKYYKMEFTLY
jgi:restriction system protein